MAQSIQDAGVLFGSQATAPQAFDVGATVATNAMTLTLNPCVLSFRSSPASNGSPTSLLIPTALTCVIPSGASLGAVNAVAARFVIICYYNGGNPVLGVANIAGGLQLDGTNSVSPTTISAAATSATTFYSASAVSANSPYCVVGIVDHTQATAGTYATTPTLVSGSTELMGMFGSLGFGQTWQNLTGSRAASTTYYNTTGKPIQVSIHYAQFSDSTWDMNFYVSGINISRDAGGRVAAGNNGGGTIGGIVPPGAPYYATGAIAMWAELR